MTERRVYRSGSTRRKLRYAAGVALAVAAVGLIYELVGLPRVAAVSPTRGAFVSQASPPIVVRVHGLDDLDGLRVTLDGDDVTDTASWQGERLTITGVELADGTHTVRVRADSSNLLRRRLDERFQFTVDTSVPAIELDPDVADGTLSTDPPEVSGSTEPRARVRLSDGARTFTTYADAEGRFVLRPDLAPGPAELSIEARDAAGNASSTALSAYIDSTRPILVLERVPKTTRKANFTLRLSASDTDNAPRILALLDGEEVDLAGKRTDDLEPQRPAVHARVRLEKLAQGKHTLVVTAVDEGGNAARARRVFVVDSTERLGAAALWPGARGRDVRELQKLLEARGFYVGDVTGRYDADTATAVELFQERYGMATDGRVDGATLTALGSRIVVDLSELRLRFYRAEKLVVTFPVAAGQSEYPTPTGTFAVIRMVVDPTWYPPNSEWAKDAKPIPPGIENPLGTRWIGTSAPDVGIHGTPSDASIGTYASHGCIRMHIPDVEALYEDVALGMTVVIRP